MTQANPFRSDAILRLKTAPVDTPVSLAEAKAHARVEPAATDEDALITSYIEAATNVIESRTGKVLFDQSWEYVLPSISSQSKVALPILPVQSILSISYFDSDNAAQTADVNDFRIQSSLNWAYIEPIEDKSWPTVYRRQDALTLELRCGWPDAASVPENLKTALNFLVTNWFETRMENVIGQSVGEIPVVDSLIEPHKVGYFQA